MNLLTRAQTGRTALRLLVAARNAVRSVVAPAALVREQQAVEPATAPDPADLFTEDELPELADIERAALGYDLAADNARSADRAKRKYRKLLDRLPSGVYGSFQVSRVPSGRQTPDLVAIRATYERLGLGDVPMRDTAPSLRVERAAVEQLPAVPVVVAALVAA